MRIFRGAVIAFFLLLLAVLTTLAASVFFNSPTRPALTYKQAIESYHFYYSTLNANKVAITFDDGPRPGISEKMMDVLEKNNAPATFFYIGSQMALYPSVVQEAARRGFTIGNHSFTHAEAVNTSESRLALELHSTEYLISRITGEASFYYRPPFLNGIGVDPSMNPYLPVPKEILWVMQSGYNPVGSDIDPEDWLATSGGDVIERLKTALTESPKGHIVLLHEEVHTLEALEEIIKTLRGAGYEIVPLDELLIPPTKLELTHTLRVGSTDRETDGEVSLLQWFLYKNGDLDPYLITGTFDQSTREALSRFQFRSKLATGNSAQVSVGATDEKTREALAAAAAAVLASPIESKGLPGALYRSQIGDFFKYVYVNFFTGAHATLAFMVRVALFLVFLRCFIVLAFLTYGYFTRKPRQDLNTLRRLTRRQGVSILIPAYNEQENIRATIESVLRSTHARREIIVIDDGSTDRTGDIVRQVIAERTSEPIRLIRVENGGKARALNHGLKSARYDVCTVLDADAVIEPDAITNFLIHFIDPEIGAVAGKVGTTHSHYTLDLFQALEYAIGQNIDKRAVSILGAVGVVPGPAGAWRKSFVLDLGGFSSDTLVEDQDMTLTLLRAGKKVAYEEKALAFTETPHTVKNFLKQRFRWVYGTMQCFWKHKFVVVERPFSSMTWIVMPNIFIFNILLPLSYPFADSALIVGLFISDWAGLLAPFAFFTILDVVYASIGAWPEKNRWKLICMVPLQRIVYRQLLYYSVMRGVVRAIEGTGSGWNKFAKVGETQRFYFSAASSRAPITHAETAIPVIATPRQSLYAQNTAAPLNKTKHQLPQEIPEVVTMPFQGPSGTSKKSTKIHSV
jgi:cellulose synthase/poly-beta-1,6-N-acetylglucosamine synthase-like glycosyltransferase/peptidoglycan/xylan/chitin deacetylase (PgdA/CDA1 family)